jgi:hypothetical protein
MKAPNVDIKDLLKKLSFLKNNLALLVPILIALVALLLLIPTRILGSKLRTTVEEQSVRSGTRISSLIRDVNSVAEAEAMQAEIDARAADVNAIEALMAHTVERELLRYDIFGPDTNETSRVLFERFGAAYRSAIDDLLASVNAGLCPTREEIQTALKSVPRPAYQMGAGGGYGGGMDPYGGMGGMGRGQSLGIVTEADQKMVDQICQDRARTFQVYASPADVGGYAFWNDWTFEDKDTAYQDCWYWQIGYWIIEDVLASVQSVNASADSVASAPIKRVMSVDFTLKQNRSMRGRMRGGARRSKDTVNPTYAMGPSDVLTTPCTGRYTSPVDEMPGIDVVHFNVRIIIDTTQVERFMAELCSAKPHTFRGFYGDQPPQTYEHNQITILETSQEPVVDESYEHYLYRYGDKPVVELNLIGEYLFERTAAFEEIKPRQVKEALREDDEDA